MQPLPAAPPVPPLLVWSHGRSGSTLLLDFLASDPQLWSTFEPLQEVRQRPHDANVFHIDGTQSCRDRMDDAAGGGKVDAGSVTLASSCPLRDACLLLSLLHCNHMPLLATWYGELDLTGQRAAFLPERLVGPNLGRGAAWLPTPYFGRLSDTRARAVIADERECREHPRRIAKTIRLNGHLDAIINVSRALGWTPPVILHLVRDPRAIYASRRRLSSPFGLPTARTTRTAVRAWARGLCSATHRDALVGRQLGSAGYEQIDYSSFVRHPRELAERLYSKHFGRPVPSEVLEYVARHLPAAARHNHTGDRGSALRSADSPHSWQFQYGTAARDVEAVDQRWKLELKSWERQTIEAACKLS
jgi:hypothetical protein